MEQASIHNLIAALETDDVEMPLQVQGLLRAVQAEVPAQTARKKGATDAPEPSDDPTSKQRLNSKLPQVRTTAAEKKTSSEMKTADAAAARHAPGEQPPAELMPQIDWQALPRACSNALTTQGGKGSCWLAAAMQALWSSGQVHEFARAIFNSTSAPNMNAWLDRFRNQRPPVRQKMRLENIQSRTSAAITEDSYLAMAFVESRMAPHDLPFSPNAMLHHYYRKRQEDAAEFLTRFVFDPDVAPRHSAFTLGTLAETLIDMHALPAPKDCRR